MCPRKARYNVPKHIVDSIRSKTKSVSFGPYVCPECGTEKLRIIIRESSQKCYVRCTCGLMKELTFNPNNEAIDYYNDFMDNY